LDNHKDLTKHLLSLPLHPNMLSTESNDSHIRTWVILFWQNVICELVAIFLDLRLHHALNLQVKIFNAATSHIYT